MRPNEYQVKVIKYTKGVNYREKTYKQAGMLHSCPNGYSSYMGERSYLYAAL
jgi:hypothetical protein